MHQLIRWILCLNMNMAHMAILNLQYMRFFVYFANWMFHESMDKFVHCEILRIS